MRDGWRRVTLGHVLTQSRASVEVASLLVVPYAGVRLMGRGVYSRDPVPASKVKAKSLTPIRERQVVYNRMWATRGSFGVAGADVDGCLVTNDFPVFDVASSVDPGYMSLVFETPAFQTLAAGAAVGTTERRRLHETDFLALEVDLPPLAEQRRIVDLICAVDEAGVAARRVGDRARAAADSLRERHFADPTVEPVPLSDLTGKSGIQIGPFGSQLHASDYVATGVPVVMPQDLVDGKISQVAIARVSEADAARLGRHRLAPGDIILPRRGDLSKRALVGPDHAGWLCGTGSVRVRVADEEPAVVFHAMRTIEVNAWLNANAVGATMPNLNTAIVARLPIRIPEGSRAVTDALHALEEVASHSLVTAKAAAAARDAILVSLLHGERAIPDTYDRFLDGAA
jgi:type I restriction enzyme S subunit